MSNIRSEPFEDIDMAKKWDCKYGPFIFVPLTHIIAHVIVNNYELELMGWKFDEKYMLVPKYVVTLITKELDEKVVAEWDTSTPAIVRPMVRPNASKCIEGTCTCIRDEEWLWEDKT